MSIFETNGELIAGSKAVATAGTPVCLVSASTPCTDVWIHAFSTNTKPVAIGSEATVDGSAGASRIGAVAPPTSAQPLHFEIDDLKKIWIDSEVNGEGVSFTYKVP